MQLVSCPDRQFLWKPGQQVVKDKTKKLKLEEKETLVVEERGPIEDSTKKK